MTNRERLERGGSHSQALLRAVDSGSIKDLLDAYGRADRKNKKRYEVEFPGIGEIALRIWNVWPCRTAAGLAVAFPVVGKLDDEYIDPYKEA